MKIVSINNAPTIRDHDNILRSDITDLGKIVDAIDTAEGRNDALKDYIFALRDLQHAHDASCYEQNDDEIDAAHARVAQTFDALIVAQFSLDCVWQSASCETKRLNTIKSAIRYERSEFEKALHNFREAVANWVPKDIT